MHIYVQKKLLCLLTCLQAILASVFASGDWNFFNNMLRNNVLFIGILAVLIVSRLCH